jgi:hypothetical protein
MPGTVDIVTIEVLTLMGSSRNEAVKEVYAAQNKMSVP